MIDLTLALDDLKRATKLLTRARTATEEELIDLTAEGGEVRFAVTGREHCCDAEVASAGSVRFPLAIFAKLAPVAATSRQQTVWLRIEPDRIRVNTMHIKVETTAFDGAQRAIDLPDDASLNDVLALPRLFSSVEIAESALARRLEQADAARAQLLEEAAAVLAPLGLSVQQMSQVHEEALRTHTETIRGVLMSAKQERTT